jgi:GNAT superfamily N-acetyltransferase
MIDKACDMCGGAVSGDDLEAYGEAFLAHVRSEHAELPFPDAAVRNYGESLGRMTGSATRLDAIGTIEVHPVTPDRIDDWLQLFDFDAMVGTPQNGGCYCLEAHETTPDQPAPTFGHWRERRATMIDRLRDGRTFGYLAYVDGLPAGWVNASKRGDYTLHRRGDEEDDRTVGIACFAIAPPYRGHGLATELLRRVMADAPSRGASAVEAYPVNAGVEGSSHFRGPRSIYDDAGFTEVTVRQRDTVVRRDL